MKEQLFELLEDLFEVEPGTITEDTTAVDLEKWDSLGHVMMIGALEDELGITIPMEEALEITTVAEILEYLK